MRRARGVRTGRRVPGADDRATAEDHTAGTEVGAWTTRSCVAWSTLGLGVVSAFVDNIPLTALAIKQGGYDWGYLACCVGYGGSMLWFGSSAGVAISGMFAEAKSAKQWLGQGWHVAVGYVLGFLVMQLLLGWHPAPPAHAANAAPIPSHEMPSRPAH